MGTQQGAGSRKVLVVYYSLSGNTARVARDIAKQMGADIESIVDKQHGVGFTGYLKCVVDAVRESSTQIAEPACDPSDYALTIVGTPVWAGKIAPAVRTYLKTQQSRFKDVAFFVTSGGTEASEIVPAMELLADRQAVACSGFDAHDLADCETYNRKIAAFVRAFRGWPASQDSDNTVPPRARWSGSVETRAGTP